jgi:poly-D-alanine transfer protein DltD
LNAGDVSAADPGARSVEFKLKDRSRQTDTAIMEIDSIVRASREDARAVLEASAAGKWALIHGSDEVETFDSFDDAAAQAVKEFGVGSYLIRTAGASTVTLPASVVFQRA